MEMQRFDSLWHDFCHWIDVDNVQKSAYNIAERFIPDAAEIDQRANGITILDQILK